ncbi:MAG TPA: D-aminoacyl-tRNA deacylase [Thermoplasmata archaeon]|nr:D-aminoacyl-tRNA deacylase [Thermoplasmata archaeon]
MDATHLIVLSRSDPVARAVLEEWGSVPATGDSVDGAPLRQWAGGPFILVRDRLHIHDDWVERRLPAVVADQINAVVYASIHRSESGTRCFTVHPLGNFGSSAEVGGAAHFLVPAAPRLMTDALRRLDEGGEDAGIPATFEATHHGPLSHVPSFFAEIGFGADPSPPVAATRVLARVLPEIRPDPQDRVVVGVGGGHYAPHFTDLALHRHWAFGHIISRHALLGVDGATAQLAMEATPGAEGALYARRADLGLPSTAGLQPRLSEGLAGRRDRPGTV